MIVSQPSQRTTPTFGVWVTDPGVTTGQSIVTERVVALMAPTGMTRFSLVSGMGLHALSVWFRAITRLATLAVRGRLHTLYLVCSRSNAGFLRDLPAYLARRMGVRVIVHVHGSDIVDLLQRRGVGAWARWAVQGCTLIVPSAHLVEPLAHLGVYNCLVCENFVSEPLTAPLPTKKTSDATFVVLWNSNVMASKGFFAVAEAVALLHEEGMSVRMVALGAPLADEAMTEADCSTRLAALATRPWMDYRGPVDRTEARQALISCDVVCLPSYYTSECQPLALLEAMCMDKPLLVTDTIALRATVRDHPCETVSQTDASTLAQALRRSRAAEGPHRAALLRSAGEQARQRFSAGRFDKKMREVLGLETSSSAITIAQR